MELWRVRKEYRAVARKLRRSAPHPLRVEAEQRVVLALAACDRLETETSVLRNARRYSAARVGRLVRWVRNAALLRGVRISALRRFDARVTQELAGVLVERGLTSLAAALRQGLDELAHLEQRVASTRARLASAAAQAGLELQTLAAALHAPSPSLGQ